jgi:hypothetical protein|tara:strand:- start:3157 stop:3666 length:510 start_codon:yes stop_codon:yes gene_type:complete
MKSPEIINRVANSALITINLEDYYPVGARKVFDIKDWLYKGLVLREKEFRTFLESHEWDDYQNTYIALCCSSDAVIPAWAFMLVSLKLSEVAKQVVVGDLEVLETTLYQNIINNLDLRHCENKAVIVKGCSEKPVPQNAYLFLIDKLKPIAKSILYGEACSSVPLYKKK